MDYSTDYDILIDLLTKPVIVDGKMVSFKEELDKLYIRDTKISAVRIRKMVKIIKKTAHQISQDANKKRKEL